jgi:hypothetical protein
MDASRQEVLNERGQIIFNSVNLDALHHGNERYDGVGCRTDIVDQQCFEGIRLSLKHSGLFDGVHRAEPSNRRRAVIKQEGRISVSSSLLAATMIQKSSLRENRALSHRR